jgi:hypothetical protein
LRVPGHGGRFLLRAVRALLILSHCHGARAAYKKGEQFGNGKST